MSTDLIADIYPLSPMQKGMLFHTLADARGGMYVEHLACTFRGDLDVEAFRRAWQRLIDRHAVLRTSYVWDDLDHPVQVVNLQVDVPLHTDDWRHLDPAARDRRLRSLLDQDRRQGYELAEAPLMRLWLHRIEDDACRFVWSYHHALMDGWCNGLVLGELLAHYEAARQGRETALPEPRPYRDYIAWLDAQDLNQSLAFWKRTLEGIDVPTPLVVVHNPNAPLTGFVCTPWSLGRAMTAKLGSFARRNQVTLNTIVQAALALVLSRYHGGSDVVFGVVVSGRPPGLDGSETMVGLFLNTVPLRARIEDELAIAPWLQQIQRTFQGIREHEYVPLSEIHGQSQIPRGTPLFNVNLVFENYPFDSSGLPMPPGVEIDDVQTAEQGSFPLSLVVRPGEALSFETRYYRSCLDDAAAERLQGHLATVLEAIADERAPLVGDLPLMTAAEQVRMREMVSGPVRERAPHCLHEHFEAQVERTPGDCALEFDGEALTYGELNARANRLARHLRSLGIGPEALVGLMMERSVDLVVALYAVLKTGAAYVPFDPDYPAARLQNMLDDSRVPILLVQPHLRDRLPATGARILDVASMSRELEDLSADNLPNAADPMNLAYAIFTSGSTGRPKGAMNTHEAICNRILWMQERYGLTAADRVMQKTPFSFDVSVWEFFWPLIAGARLVLAKPGGHQDAAYLVDLIEERRITTLHFVPSMLNAFVEQTRLERCRTLKRIICSGEALSADLQQRTFLRLPHVEIHNLYGPTEAAVDVTSWECRRDDQATMVPIGEPISNLRIHILDRHRRPVPIDVPGELHIGGLGLARGYCGRPDLTAERFVPNPLSEAGERLYRTGDLACHRQGGSIDFLGRIDHQVKIRGNRIELGEIEAAIAQHPATRQSVVTVIRNGSAEARLVAYIASDSKEPPTVTEWRRFVAERLPDYMVPAAFVTLPELPLLPNGKIDRKSLPELSRERPPLETEFIAPRTTLENYLAELWRESLGLEQVGVFDPFFDLGGDSIKGVSLINRIQERLERVVHIVVLFDAPTIADMAVFLQREYPDVVVAQFGEASMTDEVARAGVDRSTLINRVDALDIQQARIIFSNPALSPPSPNGELPAKNPPAAFLLSPPRSGSTLLRVVLAGNPQLFAPPELELLPFDTLSQRAAMFTGRESFWQEGALRAVMDVKRCSAEESKEIVTQMEGDGVSVQQFYRQLQDWIGERRLIDKTPSYAMDLNVLQRAERMFDSPRYIHLVRHPCGMIRSFEEARLDQIYGGAHGFSRRALAEVIWAVCQLNILEFLEHIPSDRQHRVSFEEFVHDPEGQISRLCGFLGVEYAPGMIDPYAEKEKRMTDGILPQSRMQGDVKFHQHSAIDPAVADRWREDADAEARLGPYTWQIAESIGYRPPAELVQSVSTHQQARIIPRPRPERIPLSFAQQRLWFLERLSPGSPFYNIPFAVRFQGPFVLATMRQAVNELVRRHESLRTRFVEHEGDPVQVIAPEMTIDVPRLGLEQVARSEIDDRIREIVKQHARQPFDLARGPLVRVSVLQIAPDDHVVMVNLHHIIADGWSLNVFLRESVALYLAALQNRPSPLPELPVQYADYALLQRETLQGPALTRQLDYWRSRLAAITPLELPADRPRPDKQSYEGHTNRYLLLTAAQLKQIKALSVRAHCTLFMTLLAAFQTLLHRYTGRDDIVVGSPTANRDRAELEALIGFFVNMLVMRTSLSENPTFLDLLARVREVVLGAFAHQDLPFEQVVVDLQPERNLSREPLFQVAFALQNAPRPAMKLIDVTLVPLESTSETAKFDLTVFAWESEEGLASAFNYSTSLFDSGSIDRMSGHFRNLLLAVLDAPDQRVSDIPLEAVATPTFHAGTSPDTQEQEEFVL